MPSITSARIGSAEARKYLERAAFYDTTGGGLTVEDVMQRCELYSIDRDGVQIGAYAIEDDGLDVWVVAAAGDGKVLDDLIGLLQQRWPGRRIALTTIRKGLVKKLMRRGFGISGITIRKHL